MVSPCYFEILDGFEGSQNILSNMATRAKVQVVFWNLSGPGSTWYSSGRTSSLMTIAQCSKRWHRTLESLFFETGQIRIVPHMVKEWEVLCYF